MDMFGRVGPPPAPPPPCLPSVSNLPAQRVTVNEEMAKAWGGCGLPTDDANDDAKDSDDATRPHQIRLVQLPPRSLVVGTNYGESRGQGREPL